MIGVSVIVPVYNAGEYLPVCVESILSQQYDGWELLLVDNGSADGSERVCAAWAGRDERFKLLRLEENAGPNAARAHGLKAARGEWVGFVDADDLVHPRFAEALLAAAEGTALPIACCRYQPFMGASPRPGADGPPPAAALAPPRHIEALLHDQRVDYSLCNKLYRRGALTPEMLAGPVRYNEDLLANWQAFGPAKGLAFVNWVGYYYRQNPASATRRGLPPAFFADQAAVAARIRDEAAGGPLAASAWAFYYEKLLYLHSMILRQDAPDYFERERRGLESELRARLGKALGCRALRPRMKLVALLACLGGGAYRRLCRLVLRDRQM